MRFKYDALNRLLEKRMVGPTGTWLASYGYDTSTTGITNWAYDLRGRVLTETKAITGAGTFTTSYRYDPMDRVITMTYPTNEVITQTYNIAAPRSVAQVRSATHNVAYVSGLTYNPLGQLTQMRLGNTLPITNAEFEIFNWPSALRALYASMCVAAPNCSLGFDSANKENVLTRIQTINSVTIVWNDQQQLTEYYMNSVVAMGMSADFIAPSALGRLRPPSRPLLSNENVLLTEAQGLQTRTSNLFDNVILGSHGDQTTKYLWTIDSRGVNIALEQTPFPTPRGNIVDSNLSSGAYFAGEAWFTSAKEIVINAGSGRWGDRSGVTQEMWQAAIKIWESLGYTVTALPLGER